MTTVLVYSDASANLGKVLDIGNFSWKAIDDVAAAGEFEPVNGWDGAVITVNDDTPEIAFNLAKTLRARENAETSIMLLVSADSLPELTDHTELFDEFCLTPFHPAELEARLELMLARTDGDSGETIISYGPLSLNVETYQAVIDGRALDLTYMEYELLRYLASQPGKVFGREILLSEVWGYDYYGGARTVDVHIRRLRAKMGEEHANLISTVRSVGYRFGQARWT
jgi:DNA-binding response OmpR family regulator